MSQSPLASSIAIAGVALLAWLLVHIMFRKITSRAAAFAVALLLIVAGAVAVVFVDTNIPVEASHFRPGGELAPVWVALSAWGARVGAIVGLFYFARWSTPRKSHI